jgi:hypothetical protein
MENKEIYKELLQTIVEKHLPEEAMPFDIDSDRIVEDASIGKRTIHQTGHGNQYGAADPSSVKAVLDIIVIAFTGYRVFLEILKLRKENKAQPDYESLIPELEKTLKANGIKSTHKARAIAEDFVKQASSLTQK